MAEQNSETVVEEDGYDAVREYRAYYERTQRFILSSPEQRADPLPGLEARRQIEPEAWGVSGS